MKLTQIDKNVLYLALESATSDRLRKLAVRVYGDIDESNFEELEEIKSDMELLEKLSKDNWQGWAE